MTIGVPRGDTKGLEAGEAGVRGACGVMELDAISWYWG